jgi:two-component system, OmpR family, sensor histidine kinase BaeS
LVVLVLLVAALASLVASIVSGNSPPALISVTTAAVVLIGIFGAARWLWRSTRSIAALMDAADRVAGGDYSTRVGQVPARGLQRLAGAFDEMTQRLETNEKRRRELFADIAHELRTPLQAIRGTVEGMLDGLYPSDEEHLRPVLERTVVMARLLEDLRTLSMAEAGVLTLHKESVDPAGVANDAIEAQRSAADEAGVGLTCVAQPGTPATIDADPVRLSEVLTNLLVNAVQHTPRGGQVSLSVSLDGARGVVYQVDDTGSGIPADKRPLIFDRFVTSADRGGTGLGLAIAKRLVEAHGGRIEATDAPGGGTRISFNVPSLG